MMLLTLGLLAVSSGLTGGAFVAGHKVPARMLACAAGLSTLIIAICRAGV